jgi:hypothetical protein
LLGAKSARRLRVRVALLGHSTFIDGVFIPYGERKHKRAGRKFGGDPQSMISNYLYYN